MYYPGVTDLYDPAAIGPKSLNSIHYWNETNNWKFLYFQKIIKFTISN